MSLLESRLWQIVPTLFQSKNYRSEAGIFGGKSAMDYVWWSAAAVVGVMLGLHFGRLLTASIAYWEGTTTAYGVFRAVFLFILGSGGGAALFGTLTNPHNLAFYLIGLGVGGIAGFVLGIPSRWTLQTVRVIVRFSEATRNITDLERRSRYILAILVPPARIVRDEGIDEEGLADDLEEGSDG
jgi:hypothetical protein